MLIKLTVIELLALVAGVATLTFAATAPITARPAAPRQAQVTQAVWKSDTLLDSGLIKLLNREFEAALTDFEQAAHLTPGRARCHVRIAQAQSGARRYTDAEAALKLALCLEPGDPQILDSLATIQLLQERPNAAMATAKLALERAPHVTEIWESLGWAHASAGEWSEAEQSFRKALELTPGSEVATRGIAYLAGTQPPLIPVTVELARK